MLPKLSMSQSERSCTCDQSPRHRSTTFGISRVYESPSRQSRMNSATFARAAASPTPSVRSGPWRNSPVWSPRSSAERDQTVQRETGDGSLAQNLEIDALELAAVAGSTLGDRGVSPSVQSFAADLTEDETAGGFSPAEQFLDSVAAKQLRGLTAERSGGDGLTTLIDDRSHGWRKSKRSKMTRGSHCMRAWVA